MAAANEEPLTHLRLIQMVAWDRHLYRVSTMPRIRRIADFQRVLLEIENSGRRLDDEAAENRRRRAQRNPGAPEQSETRATMQPRVDAVLVRINLRQICLDAEQLEQERLEQEVQEEPSVGRMFQRSLWLQYFHMIAQVRGDRMPRLLMFDYLSFLAEAQGDRIDREYEERGRRAQENPEELQLLVEEHRRMLYIEVYTTIVMAEVNQNMRSRIQPIASAVRREFLDHRAEHTRVILERAREQLGLLLHPEAARGEVQRPNNQPRLMRNRRGNNNQEQAMAREEPNPPQQRGRAIQEPLTHLRLIQNYAWRYLNLTTVAQRMRRIGEFRTFLMEVEERGRQLDGDGENQGAPADERDRRRRMRARAHITFNEILQDFGLELWRNLPRENRVLPIGRLFENALWLQYFFMIAREHGDRIPRFQMFDFLGFLAETQGDWLLWRVRRNPEEPELLEQQRMVYSEVYITIMMAEVNQMMRSLLPPIIAVVQREMPGGRRQIERGRVVLDRTRQQLGLLLRPEIAREEVQNEPGPIRNRRRNNHREQARAREERNPVRRRDRGQN